MADLANKNLYLILDVAEDASEKELVKAYRKKALKCHPDKNPDNPKAAELFHELSKALEVLTDAAARAAYDKIRAAQKKAEERNKALDSKRRRLKEDLEAKESAAQTDPYNRRVPDLSAAEKLQAEIERLQKEGSRILEQEQELMREELKNKGKVRAEVSEDDDNLAPKLRVKWTAKKDDPDNGGYSYEFLHKAFSKYGPVSHLLVSSKKKGSALVEFHSPLHAQAAFENEVGFAKNPLKLMFLQGQPKSNPESGCPVRKENSTCSSQFLPCDDFEQSILMRMRQAQQAKEQSNIHEKKEESAAKPISTDNESDILNRLHQVQQAKSGSSENVDVLVEPAKILKAPKPPPVSLDQRNFESLSDMKARQAAERKRLIEQLQAEDD